MKVNSFPVFILGLFFLAAAASAEAPVINLDGGIDFGFPLGIYAPVAGISLGGELGAGIQNLIWQGFYLGLHTSYSYIFADNFVSTSMTAWDMDLHVGYVFTPAPNWNITPILGAGTICHTLDVGNIAVFWDIYLSAAVKISMDLPDDWALYLTPRFNVFFEQTNIGFIADTGLGISKKIEILAPDKNETLKAQIKSNNNLFSPDGNGTLDTISFSLQASGPYTSYTLEVLNTSGIPVKRLQGSKPVPGSIIWDGKQDNWLIAPNGTYTGRLTVF